MAYIELEAVIEVVKKEREYFGKFSYEDEPAFMVGFHQAITFALSDISSIPAADVQPVVRGKWIIEKHRTYYDTRCSVCGIKSFVSIEPKDAISFCNYCPNCGADMRAQLPEEKRT